MRNAGSAIDVWDLETFDTELLSKVSAHSSLIRNYFQTCQQLRLEWEAVGHSTPYPENPYAYEFRDVIERDIMPLVERRTLRAWHYTRMTDAEVLKLRRDGIYLSSEETIRSRFAEQVAAGTFSQEVADRLWADSPYQSEQFTSRSNKFWMTSHPRATNDSGVTPLLESWGGESAYFWQRDQALQRILTSIGRPRILEVAVPVDHTKHAYAAAVAVIGAYGRNLDCRACRDEFDLCAHLPIGPDHVLAVHSEGDQPYVEMGRGYPSSFAKDR